MLSHRLSITIEQSRRILFGSSTTSTTAVAQNSDPSTTVVHEVILKLAGILHAHCELYMTPSGSVTLEVKQDALVSVNGERILDVTRKLKDGDYLLIGQNVLFALRMSDKSFERVWSLYKFVAWTAP